MQKLSVSLFFIFSLFAFSVTKGQTNIVPNGSFETYTTCPSSIGEVSSAISWTSLKLTPDYYNACSTNTCNCYIAGQLCSSVPYNCFGFQYAASGNAFMGFASFSIIGGNYREILGAQLTNSMSIGLKYFVKYKVVLTLDNSSNSCSDKLGVRFSTVQHNSVTALPPINNFAHVYTSSLITDTLNWTTVFKSFVADSNYTNVEVGNFFDDGNTNYIALRPQATNTSYYYFDDFCVSTDSLFALNYTTGVESFYHNSNLRVYPNPSDGRFLYFNQNIQEAEISIIDVYGMVIKSMSVNYTDKILVDLPSGIYFINIITPSKLISEKIIINNP